MLVKKNKSKSVGNKIKIFTSITPKIFSLMTNLDVKFIINFGNIVGRMYFVRKTSKQMQRHPVNMEYLP